MFHSSSIDQQGVQRILTRRIVTEANFYFRAVHMSFIAKNVISQVAILGPNQVAPCWVLSIRPNVRNILVLTGEVGRARYFIYPKLRDKYQIYVTQTQRRCIDRNINIFYLYKVTTKSIKEIRVNFNLSLASFKSDSQ